MEDITINRKMKPNPINKFAFPYSVNLIAINLNRITGSICICFCRCFLFHNTLLLNTKNCTLNTLYQAPTKAKKASKSMDFYGGIKFKIDAIKIHTLAHATANALGKFSI